MTLNTCSNFAKRRTSIPLILLYIFASSRAFRERLFQSRDRKGVVRCRTRNRSLTVAALFVTPFLTHLISVAPASATVVVNVSRVGFRTLTQGEVVRYGQWMPIVVDVELVGEASFEGKLRIAQYDADGDAGFDEQLVSLTEGAGDHQRYTLYAVASPVRGQMRVSVELLDANNEIVEVSSQGIPARRALPAMQPVVRSHDDILILSLSDRVIGPLQDLVKPDPDGKEFYERTILVAHMSPSALPEHWIGLESVDYIVWDDARPELITVRQLEALIEWVKQGGTLMIAASKTAPSLSLSPGVADILPVTVGEVLSVDDLPALRRKFLESEKDDGFVDDVPVVAAKLQPGAIEIASCRATESTFIARKNVGLGSVLFLGMTLHDFLSGPTGSAVPLFRKLFHMRLQTGDPPTPVSLFPRIVGAVSFGRSAGLYLLLAGLFSVAYLLTATLGTWWFLDRRGWRKHSWSAFASVAVIASFLSMIAVQSLRGISDRVHQLCIVDVEAGDGYARATVFFGLKTCVDRRVDVWLPSDPDIPGEPGLTNCMIRSLPSGYGAAEVAATFIDPTQYHVVPASAGLQGVRCRATLRRFEGRWQGPLRGSFTGQIAVRRNRNVERKPDGPTPRDRLSVIKDLMDDKDPDRAPASDWRISDDSYVVNELGVDLKDCYLLHTVFSLEQLSNNRSGYIYAYPIGDIASDGKKVMLAPLCYTTDGTMTVFEHMQNNTLAKAQLQWSGAFHGLLATIGFGTTTEAGYALGEERQALLLLSTIGEYDPTRDATMAQTMVGLRTWSRDRARQLDLRDSLQPGSVYLIGFSDTPGPPRLYVRSGNGSYRKMQPEEASSRAMYRIRLPAMVEGAAALEVDEQKDVSQ